MENTLARRTVPPLARHQLAVLVLPADPDRDPADVVALVAAWRAAGLGLDGPRPIVAGGAARLRVEAHPTPRFVANRQGGFRVRCPVDGRNVVPAFNPAVERWREGGPRTLACPCGRTHDLDALDFAPAAGFARGWVALEDCGGAELDPEAAVLAARALGGMRLVLRRG